LNFKL